MSEDTNPQGGEGDVAQIGVAKQDLVKMQAPDDCTSVSIGGMQFDIPANGVVECPGAVADQLASHGFTPVATQVRKSTRAKVQA